MSEYQQICSLARTNWKHRYKFPKKINGSVWVRPKNTKPRYWYRDGNVEVY